MDKKNKEIVNIEVSGKIIKVSKKVKELCDKYNFVPSEETGKKIITLHSPHGSFGDFDMRANFFKALVNFVYTKRYGLFIQYLPDGTVRKSNYLYNLVKEHIDDNCLYNFELFDERGIVPKYQTINFFESNIERIDYDCIHLEPIPYYLNQLIKTEVGLITKCAKGNQEQFFTDMEWRMFGICKEIKDLYSDYQKVLKRKENITIEEYETTLKKVLTRYSNNEGTFFEKVSKISNYNKAKGLYLLCYKKVRYIHVGYSNGYIGKMIMKSISPNSTTIPSNITDIYVLKIPPIEGMLKALVYDVIGTIGKTIITPQCFGEWSLFSTSDKNYNPDLILMPNDLLKTILNELAWLKAYPYE